MLDLAGEKKGTQIEGPKISSQSIKQPKPKEAAIGGGPQMAQVSHGRRLVTGNSSSAGTGLPGRALKPHYVPKKT